MNQRTRKLKTMHKSLHPRHDADRLYVSRKVGERGLDSIEDSVDNDITTQGLHRKRRRRTDYSDQKRHWQHDDQQNDNN